jgi:penicillin-binding protein 1C
MSRRTGVGWLISASICVAALGWLALGNPGGALPSFEEVREAYRPSDVCLLDRDGEVIHEARVDPTGRRLAWTPLSHILPALQAAVIASEDRRFYRHGGIDGKALLAAALRRLAGSARRGASTISMQLATLIHPDLQHRGTPRTFRQKWRQMQLARAIERRWSKVQILEAYLNLVAFRGELQGVAAATSVLFRTPPWDHRGRSRRPGRAPTGAERWTGNGGSTCLGACGGAGWSHHARGDHDGGVAGA